MKSNQSSIVTPKNRLGALADGVFAIVMTLLVLELSVPVIAESSVNTELIGKLLGLWPKFLVYMLSFIVLGTLWIFHHSTYNYITRSDGKLAWMNIIFLMFVALIPFSASLLGEYGTTEVAVAIFGINVLLPTTIGTLIWIYIITKPILADKVIDARVARQRTIMGLFGCCFYLLGIGISFISPIASLCIYALAALLSIIITWKGSHGYLTKLFVRKHRQSNKNATI